MALAAFREIVKSGLFEVEFAECTYLYNFRQELSGALLAELETLCGVTENRRRLSSSSNLAENENISTDLRNALKKHDYETKNQQVYNKINSNEVLSRGQ